MYHTGKKQNGKYFILGNKQSVNVSWIVTNSHEDSYHILTKQSNLHHLTVEINKNLIGC